MREGSLGADELAFQVATHMRARETGIAGGGIILGKARAGFASVSLLITGDMLNAYGTAHGGVIFTLADTAFAYACNGRNETTVAAHAAITFLSPGREGETLAAEAVEQAIEGRSGVYTVTVTATQGRVVAVFQGLSRKIGGEVVRVAP
jgi:acyl-CoA thioesterase